MDIELFRNFIDYLDNISESTVLVFVVYGEVDKRKKIVKKIQEKGTVFKTIWVNVGMILYIVICLISMISILFM